MSVNQLKSHFQLHETGGRKPVLEKQTSIVEERRQVFESEEHKKARVSFSYLIVSRKLISNEKF